MVAIIQELRRLDYPDRLLQLMPLAVGIEQALAQKHRQRVALLVDDFEPKALIQRHGPIRPLHTQAHPSAPACNITPNTRLKKDGALKQRLAGRHEQRVREHLPKQRLVRGPEGSD